jgi:hypothetical protein
MNYLAEISTSIIDPIKGLRSVCGKYNFSIMISCLAGSQQGEAGATPYSSAG